MSQSCFSVESFFRIKSEHSFKKINSRRRKVFPVLFLKKVFNFRFSLQYFRINSIIVFSVERRFSCQKNVHYYTTRPYITFFIVILIQHFRSYIVRGSNFFCQFFNIFEKSSIAPINYLDVIFKLGWYLNNNAKRKYNETPSPSRISVVESIVGGFPPTVAKNKYTRSEKRRGLNAGEDNG